MTKPLDPRHVEVPDEVMVDVLRRKLPEERLRIGFNMWISAYNMLMTHIRHSHPDWEPLYSSKARLKRRFRNTPKH